MSTFLRSGTYWWLVFIMVYFSHQKLWAQANPQQTWFTYNQVARLSSKWSYGLDLNHRTTTFDKFKPSTTAIRFGGTYWVKESFRITAGYAWFGTHSQNGENKWLNENRIWQQGQWFKKLKRSFLSHRIRLEERFREAMITNETKTRYSTRLRYMAQVQLPIIHPTSAKAFALYAQVADELMLHTGEGIGHHYFDQNRAIAGLALQPNRKIELAVLYQFITQYQPALQATANVHSIRFTLLHHLDFRQGVSKEN